MDTDRQQVGDDLVFLLKQQRTLYYQLKNLAEQQRQIFQSSNSPEELVRILMGRRKLIEKLRQVNSKLKPVKTNWKVLLGKLTVEEKLLAKNLATSIAEIVAQLRSMDFMQEQSSDILSDTAQIAVNLAAEINTAV